MRATWKETLGVFFLVFGVYALTGPGRIDMIDGQHRYESSERWWTSGNPVEEDPALLGFAVPGRFGRRYSRYGLGSAVWGLPFVAVVGADHDPHGEIRRFCYSFSSTLAGALVAAALLAVLRRQGLGILEALGWSLTCAFGTLLWPTATSSFTQAQTAALLMLSLSLAVRSAQERSWPFALAAGACAGLIATFDEYLVLLAPMVALATLEPPGPPDGRRPAVKEWLTDSARVLALRNGPRRADAGRFYLFLLGLLPGLALVFAYNAWRFGSPFHSGRADNLPAAHSLWGNPVIGALALLVSPGKSVFLYSPILLLGLFGLPRLWRRSPALAAGLVLTSVTLLAVIAPAAFFGGDWCWGPRYLLPVLPWWALAWPGAGRPLERRALIAVSVAVQILAVSVDHQRFFFEHCLSDFFWAEQPAFYFRNSALLSRPAELLDVLKDHGGHPRFSPSPYRGLLTYSPFGPGPRDVRSAWMRRYELFFAPRPWPLWFARIPPEHRPVSLPSAVSFFALTSLLGAVLLASSWRRSKAP
jgi:hypothetical protein